MEAKKVKELPSPVAIPVKDIHPSPNNGRPHDAEAIAELAKSIEEVGLLNAIHIRIKADAPAREGEIIYELIAGERRLNAFKKLKRDTIPAIILDDNDEEAMEKTITENLQREDLPPLGQAKQINKLLKMGKSWKEIAERLGKTVSFVARRAQLVNLSPKWVKALEKEEKIGVVNITQYEIIARLPVETQESVYEELGFGISQNNYTTAELQETINLQHLMKISAAPWAMDMPLMYEEKNKNGAMVGASSLPKCVDCPKRSTTQQELFEEFVKDGKVTDRCLDRECWKKKQEAFITEKYNSMKAESDRDIILVDRSDNYPCQPNLPNTHALKHGAVDAYKIKVVKKGDKGAREALVVDGPGAGSRIWVKPVCEGDTIKGGEKTMADKKKALEKRRVILFIGKVVEAIDRIITKPAAAGIDLRITAAAPFLAGLVARFGAESSDTYIGKDCFAGNAIASNNPVYDLLRGVLPKIREALRSDIMDEPPERTHAQAACRWFHIDAAVLIKKCEEEIPVPKSWALLDKKPIARKEGRTLEKMIGKGKTSSIRNPKGKCRVCGCTDDDCKKCIEKTGEPCHWVEPDLCSRCADEICAHCKTAHPSCAKCCDTCKKQCNTAQICARKKK